MFDQIFSAALAFVVLAGGSLAVGSEFLPPPQAESSSSQQVAAQTVQHLPTVIVTGKVQDSIASVALVESRESALSRPQ